MPVQFAHLHLHSEYSLLDGASHIDALLERAREQGMSAMALTDHGAMYGAVEFYFAARRHGVTPIIGIEAYQAQRTLADRDPKYDSSPYHLVLLAQNAEGYRNLIALTSIAHLDGFYYRPRIDKEALARHGKGLIGFSSCLQGEIPQAILRGDEQGALRAAGEFVEILGRGNFFMEVQDHGMDDERRAYGGVVELAKRLGLPLVATNDVHYVRPEDADAQDTLMCVQMGISVEDTSKPRMGATPLFYLRSPEEMAALFRDHPEALRSTIEIASRVDLTLDTERKLPHFPVPDGFTPDSYLRHLAEEGLRRLRPVVTPELRERLDYELGVIEQMGFAAYFLIVQDFVNFARRRGILTTVRGSAAGSLVLYACGVTDVDPITYRLPFERFLNPARYSMPDIDVDFMDSRRDEVIRYVMDKYGHDRVAQIITFGTMGARAAVRDVARALGVSYGDADRIAKMIPFNATLQQALDQEPRLRQAAEESAQVRRLLDLAGKLEGIARHASTHAAGVIISRDSLTDHVPLQRATKGDLVMTQYDMLAVDKIGLLKMDFLGLANLTILDTALRVIERTRGIAIDLKDVHLDDTATYDLLSSGETTGLFQVEGSGMRRYVKELKPTRIEDIMAMVALFRPGPMANIPAFIRRKHGHEPVTYLHPFLEPVLRDTYGVMVYQEDVMAVAQAVAGYTAAEADLLRYAIGKKIRERLEEQRARFYEGAKRNGVSRQIADQIWEQFEPFARYGFNRAHAASYGLVAYYTAYLKAHYPAEYMTAVLSSHSGDLERVGAAVAEAQRMGITVLPPHVNESESDFVVSPVGGIRFGLAAVKNVGQGAVEAILAARAEGGPFTSLAEFADRLDSRVVNKRVIESLVKAGAMDRLGPSRAAMLTSLDTQLDRAARAQRSRAAGQTGLFDLAAEPAPAAVDAGGGDEFSSEERLAMEKEMLGLYVTGHPLNHWRPHLEGRVTATVDQLPELADRGEVAIGGILTAVKRMTARSTGAAMAAATLEDLTGSVEVTVFPRAYEECQQALRKDAVVVVWGRVDHQDAGVKVLADRVMAVEEAPELAEGKLPARGRPNGAGSPRWQDRAARPAPQASRPAPAVATAPGALHVRVEVDRFAEDDLRWLRAQLAGYAGDHEVRLHLVRDGLEVKTLSSQSLRVRSDPALLAMIAERFGDGSVWEE